MSGSIPSPPWSGPPPITPSPRRRGVPEYDQPQPYHRILRTTDYHWWRPVAGLAVGLVSFAVLGIGVATVTLLPSMLGGGIDLAGDAEDVLIDVITSPIGMLANNLSLAAFIPAAMLALLAGHQLRPGWLGSVTGRLRWGYLAQCLALGLLVYVGYLIVAAVLSFAGAELPEATPGVGPQLGLALVVLLTTPLQAAGEEYALRGYLFQALGSWLRSPVLPIVLTSLVFALLHSGNGDPGPAGYTFFFAFGLIAAGLTYLTGGLEAAIGMHVVNNLVGLLIIALSGASPASALDATVVPWSFVLANVAWMLLYGALVVWLARRRGLARVTTASPAVATPLARLAASSAHG